MTHIRIFFWEKIMKDFEERYVLKDDLSIIEFTR